MIGLDAILNIGGKQWSCECGENSYNTCKCVFKAVPNTQPEQESKFIEHIVEHQYDWSEWVCPDPKSYLIKCCDCGLVHEVQYRVARYGEGDYCELVDDKDVQAQFRMRRRTSLQTEGKNENPWVCECGAGSYSACKCVFKAALEAKDEPWEKFCDSHCVWTNHHPDCKLAQRTWVGLTDDEIVLIVAECAASHQHTDIHFAKAIEAKLKEKNT